MAPVNKRKKQLNAVRDMTIGRRRNALKLWEERLDEYDALSTTVYNAKGKTRTFEENKLIVLGIRYALKKYLEMVELGYNILDLNWTLIEIEVAKAFKVKQEHVSSLRKEFFDSGDILVFGEENGDASMRGKAAPNYEVKMKSGRICM
jgi:hypothetical protein